MPYSVHVLCVVVCCVVLLETGHGLQHMLTRVEHGDAAGEHSMHSKEHRKQISVCTVIRLYILFLSL
jgi:hypothetical protein